MMFVIALLTALVLWSGVDSTSSPAAATPEAVIAAAACDVPHRTPAAIVESAGAGPWSGDLPEAVPYEVPAGTPADAATSRQAVATIEALIACVNADDPLGFLSLLSDGFLRRYFGSFGISAAYLATHAPAPLTGDERFEIVETRDVTILPDGRVALLMVVEPAGGETIPELTSIITLVEVDGRLLIDDWQPVTLAGESGGWQFVTGSGYQGRIVPPEEVAEYVRFLSGDVVQGAWTPTPEQIAALEAKLPAHLHGFEARYPDLVADLARYQRHYLGFVRDGRALILVNAFCSTELVESASEPVVVLDGGQCYFHVTYDPTAGTFEDLMVNGEA